MSDKDDDARELKAEAVPQMPAPELPYQPIGPRAYAPKIGLVGCGGITKSHLTAYAKMGWEVVALCDIRRESAEEKRDAYCPAAKVFGDHRQLLDLDGIDVVDVTTHPEQRVPLLRDALKAGKHVLSQKPFVTDLDVGRELVDLADREGVKLAVNQNGRWAPYFGYIRQAVKQGLLGDVVSVDTHIAWDHGWIEGTAFEKIHHIVLYDFAIHWFDIVTCLFGDRPATEVFARAERVVGQSLNPPLAANASVRYDGGLASLVFQANTTYDPAESIVVTGTRGTIRACGPVCLIKQLVLTTGDGRAEVPLEGLWFDDGFAGTMGELLCSIEEGREPENSARNNLRSLELCFAAVASADSGRPQVPGEVRTISP